MNSHVPLIISSNDVMLEKCFTCIGPINIRFGTDDVKRGHIMSPDKSEMFYLLFLNTYHQETCQSGG